MLPFGRKTSPVAFINTLSSKKEGFEPLKKGEVRMYSCGPTVYGPQHIGNLRAAVFSDTVARTLTSAGYRVKRVVNITDVGHLVGDGDEGEDKMHVGAARENISPKAIADKYAKQYLEDIRALNIDTKDIRFPRATAYIPDQITMIRTLEKRGHTYVLADGVYFDTSTFPEYGKLGNRSAVELQAGARVDMVAGKNHSQDFVLWRLAKANDLQKWPSPWGEGNPGWSIECSSMIKALLGASIDIHTGGEDHISIHHNNEIAQSEGALGVPLARYWLHNAFLTIDGEKVSKSLGNIITLTEVTARGFHPLSLRYFFLQAQYRTPQSFSWEALAASDEALRRLWRITDRARRDANGRATYGTLTTQILAFLYDDVATPQALAALRASLADETALPGERWGAVLAADAVLGLSLSMPPEDMLPIPFSSLPADIQESIGKRETARKTKDFAAADQIRIHIENGGYRVEDSTSGPIVTKKLR